MSSCDPFGPSATQHSPGTLFASPEDDPNYEAVVQLYLKSNTSTHFTRSKVKPKAASAAVQSKAQSKVPVSSEDLKERQEYIRSVGYKQYDAKSSPHESISPQVVEATTAPPIVDSDIVTPLISKLQHSKLTSDQRPSNDTSTPTKGAILPPHVNDRRAGDAKFCAEHFADKVQLVEDVKEIFKAMGGTRMVERLEQAVNEASGRVSGTELEREEIREKYLLEAKILRSLRKRKEEEENQKTGRSESEKQGVYKVGVQGGIGKGIAQSTGLRVLDLKGAQWLVDWAKFGQLSAYPHRLSVVSAPNHPLPQGFFIQHLRKPDAIFTTRPNIYSWYDVNLLAEFSLSSGNSPTLDSVGSHKMEQIAMNLVNVLTEQPSRTFAVGIAIFDKVFSLILLDWHGIRIYRLENCFDNVENFFLISAILSTLLSASIFELGLSPLLSYRGSLPYAYDPRSLDPKATSDSHLEKIILLSPSPLSPANRTPFHRGTTVYGEMQDDTNLSGEVHGSGKGRGFRVIKMAHPEQFSMEIQLINQINSPPSVSGVTDSSTATNSQYLFPILLSSWTFNPFEGQMKAGSQPTEKGKNSRAVRKERNHVQRHLEVLVLQTPVRGRSLLTAKGLRGRHLGGIYGNILEAIVMLWTRNQIVHRDISLNNILVLPDTYRGCLIDFDCGRSHANPAAAGRKERTGTRDTMSIALLENEKGFFHQPIHDVESLCYTFLKLITTLMNSLFQKQSNTVDVDLEKWNAYFKSLKWNDPDAQDEDLITTRQNMWQRTGVVKLLKWMEKLAEAHDVTFESEADFVNGLLRLQGAGIVDEIHGGDSVEVVKAPAKYGKASAPKSVEEKLVESKARREKAREMYQEVVGVASELFQNLGSAETPFFNLLCVEYEVPQNSELEKDASAFLEQHVCQEQ